jgi:HSP20 family molecular chaperone IbpA
MPTTLIPTLSRLRSDADDAPRVRQPHYECTDLAQALRIDVFVPGVDAADIEITSLGPDLVVRARKPHPVRVNFNALHLEAAQRDYELKLRLGRHLGLESLQADFRDGVLRITLPKNFSAISRINTRKVA